VNLEKAGIPTVCVITTAFQSIAEGQQRALGYPELPFVMLEHPVAVATEDEIEEKVEAIYSDLVRHLTDTPFSGAEVNDGTATSAPVTPSKDLGPFDEAIVPIRKMLQADGADLALTSRENGRLTMQLIFLENVCEECILPREALAEMIQTAYLSFGQEASEVILRDPREEG